jgi:hypothetical protein
MGTEEGGNVAPFLGCNPTKSGFEEDRLESKGAMGVSAGDFWAIQGGGTEEQAGDSDWVLRQHLLPPEVCDPVVDQCVGGTANQSP